jgi:hypothetical protein
MSAVALGLELTPLLMMQTFVAVAVAVEWTETAVTAVVTADPSAAAAKPVTHDHYSDNY